MYPTHASISWLVLAALSLFLFGALVGLSVIVNGEARFLDLDRRASLILLRLIGVILGILLLVYLATSSGDGGAGFLA